MLLRNCTQDGFKVVIFIPYLFHNECLAMNKCRYNPPLQELLMRFEEALLQRAPVLISLTLIRCGIALWIPLQCSTPIPDLSLSDRPSSQSLQSSKVSLKL